MKNTLLIIIVFLLIPNSLYAAKFSINAPTTASRNEEILATLKIQTQGEMINALSGDVVIPSGLEVSKIYDGDSVVLLWLEKPVFNKDTRVISFSGLTPGGIVGDRPVFSFIMKSQISGAFSISISNLSALKNDGNGTAVKISFSPAHITIGFGESTSTVPIADTAPPEVFVPTISYSTDIFDNQPFVSFLTQDKGVGMDHYEYATSFFGSPNKDSWTTVESPLVLPHDALTKKIYIKAVDKVSNTRVATVPGPSYYANMTLWSIIIALLILCVLFILKRLFL